MAKLYRSSVHLHHWIAHIEGCGWMVFPARENGWDERQPVRPGDLKRLWEIPLWLAFNTGLPEAVEVMQSHKAA